MLAQALESIPPIFSSEVNTKDRPNHCRDLVCIRLCSEIVFFGMIARVTVGWNMNSSSDSLFKDCVLKWSLVDCWQQNTTIYFYFCVCEYIRQKVNYLTLVLGLWGIMCMYPVVCFPSLKLQISVIHGFFVGEGIGMVTVVPPCILSWGCSR